MLAITIFAADTTKIMNEENFQNGEQPVNNTQSNIAVIGTSGVGTIGAKTIALYPLDWKTTEVKLGKGRFSQTLERPSNDLLVERSDDLAVEVPIAKDGSYSVPDATEQETIDAKYAEKIRVDQQGYNGNIPTAHSAAAFNALFQREIYVDPDCDIFGEEITVIEEIGGDDEPEFVIKHIIKTPDEKQLKNARQVFGRGRIYPDKRGRQKYVEKSNLRSAMRIYSEWLDRQEGSSVNNESFSAENRESFINETNALTQRKVVQVVVQELTGNLLD